MMNRFRLTPSVIPNLFTTMNMFCGFLSIINTAEGKFNYAAWLIIVAALFDALDGAMARLTKSSSELGIELDSLSDIISFGAAPAFLIYSTFFFQYEIWGLIVSSLLMIAGGFRLARFNISQVGFVKTHFTGLPIPVSAITIAAFILTYYVDEIGFEKPYSEFIFPMVFVISFLMVSRIKYDTIPSFTLRGLKEKPFHFIFILAAAVILFFTGGKALFFIFVFVMLFGIFRHIFNLFKRK